MFEPRTRGISGSKFTIGFVILLTLGVIVGFIAAFRFQKTMLAFDDVRLKWPSAAASIDEQIVSINSAIESKKITVDPSLLENWNEAISEFQGSSQLDRQVVNLDKLVQAYQAIKASSGAPIDGKFPARTKGMEEFIEADRELDKLQTDFIGRACQLLFGLNLSKRIYRDL